MHAQADLKKKLRELFDKQKVGVLSTQNKNRPYASLVAFAVTEDFKNFVFATPRATRKYSNITASGRAALLIDNRSNRTSDFRKAMAVTVEGKVRELRKSKKSRWIRVYAEKHSHLQEFISSPTCAVLSLDAEVMHIVERFQHVVKLHL